MKKTVLEICMILFASCLLTLGYYGIVGEPNREIVCVSEDLEPHHVCMQTVIGDWGGEVQWVDARTRKEWEKNGIEGSVLLTDDAKENFNDLLNASMEAIFMASQQQQKVVIYCNGVACGSSKAVHAKLIEQGIYEEIYILHGGWKALSQELAKETSVLNQ